MQKTPSTLPLERLFAQLKSAGFPMDTRRKLRIWRALREKGGDYVGRIEELKYLLAPLVATNGAEQRRFYQIFDEFWAECQSEESSMAEEAKSGSFMTKKKSWYKWAYWVVWALALGVTSYLKVCRQDEISTQTSFDHSFLENNLLREGDTLRLDNITHDPLPDSMRWEIRDVVTDSLEYNDTSRHLTWVAQGYGEDKHIRLLASDRLLHDKATIHIHCFNPPRLDTIIWPIEPLTQNKKYTFKVIAEPSAHVFWVFDSRDTLEGPLVEYALSEDGQPRVECFVARPGQETDCYELETKTLTVGSDKPFLQLAELTYDEPRLLRQLAPWVWALLALPLLAAAWFFFLWWQKRRKKPVEKSDAQLAADYPIHDRAPYFIPYRPQDHRIGALADFYRMAEVLIRREEDERRSFDAPASVEATIAGGGFPSWRERAHTSPPDYLFLVTRATERDQQGRLFERLTTFLKNQDAPLTTFFHDGDFRRFWNPEHPEGVSPEWLGRHFSDHQLVLIGDGHGLLNPYDTRRAAFHAHAAPLLRWRKRLLLTPAPVAGWSYQEALLHHYFLLYPADTEGLLDGFEALDALDEFEPGPYTLWEARLARLRRDQNDRYRAWATAAEHRDFLLNDLEAFRWLCALAVTTQPDYALTIAIGHALGVEVTHDRLLRLARIPWLSANEPANTLRLDLLAQLTPTDERLARQAAAAELEAVREQVAESFAETDWRVNLAIHRFALDPRDEAHKQLLRELLQLGLLSGSQIAELDWIVQNRADGAGLPAGSTDDLEAWLGQRPPKAFWTWELWGALGGLALAAGLAFFGWDYNRRQVEQVKADATSLAVWQMERTIDDEALRMHNMAVGIGKRLAEMEYRQWEIIADDSIAMADSLFKRAVALSGGSERYPLAANNAEAFDFNIWARRLNFFLEENVRMQELEKLSSSFSISSPIDNPRPLWLASFHCAGLCNFYLFKRKGNIEDRSRAISAYESLYALTKATYFDSLRTTMPVNLETLLAAEGLINQPKYALNLLVLDSETRRPVPSPTLAAPRVRGSRDGRLSYRYPDNAPARRFAATIAAPGYPAWKGFLMPRSDGRIDTIFLTIPSSPLERRPGGDGGAHLFPVERIQEGDFDGDGVPDDTDQCRNDPGPAEYKGCPPPTDPVQRLAVEKPTEGLIREALKDFVFDQTGPASSGEAANMLKIFATENNFQSNIGGPIFVGGTLPSKYILAISVGSNGKSDRYGIIIGEPSGLNFDEMMPLFEIVKPTSFILPIPEMIFVQGGTLRLGCTDEQGNDCEADEKPPHQVTLSDYYLSRTEITNAQYAAFLNDYGSATVKSGEYQGQTMIEEHRWGIRFPDPKGDDRYASQPGYEQHPVVNVSWYGATEYCRWLSEKTVSDKTGQRYTLPTEAEWEYAARSGQKADPKQPFKYAGSDNLNEVGWYSTNSNSQTHSVGQKRPNALGLYDMSGNVWEWCADWYGERYYDEIAKGARNPIGPVKGTRRVLHGGSWSLNDFNCRVALRDRLNPELRGHNIGFRVVRR